MLFEQGSVSCNFKFKTDGQHRRKNQLCISHSSQSLEVKYEFVHYLNDILTFNLNQNLILRFVIQADPSRGGHTGRDVPSTLDRVRSLVVRYGGPEGGQLRGKMVAGLFAHQHVGGLLFHGKLIISEVGIHFCRYGCSLRSGAPILTSDLSILIIDVPREREFPGAVTNGNSTT